MKNLPMLRPLLVLICILFATSCNKNEVITDINSDPDFDYKTFVDYTKQKLKSDFKNGKVDVSAQSSHTDGGSPRKASNSKQKNITYRAATMQSGFDLSNTIDLSTIPELSQSEIALAQPFIDQISSFEDDMFSVAFAAASFNHQVGQSASLTNEEKIRLGQFSALVSGMADILSENSTKFVLADLTNGGHVLYIDPQGGSPQGGPGDTGGCKVKSGEVVRSAVYNFWKGTIYGGIAGCTGGTVTIPGVGTIAGCVGGAILGGASGFVGGAIDSVAQQLLYSCLNKKPVIPMEDAMDFDFYAIYEPGALESVGEQVLHFPQPNMVMYYASAYELVHDENTNYGVYINRGSGNTYFFYPSLDSVCILPDGFYFDLNHNKCYHVQSGLVKGIYDKPAYGPFEMKPLQDDLGNIFQTCN